MQRCPRGAGGRRAASLRRQQRPFALQDFMTWLTEKPQHLRCFSMGQEYEPNPDYNEARGSQGLGGCARAVRRLCACA